MPADGTDPERDEPLAQLHVRDVSQTTKLGRPLESGRPGSIGIVPPFE